MKVTSPLFSIFFILAFACSCYCQESDSLSTIDYSPLIAKVTQELENSYQNTKDDTLAHLKEKQEYYGDTLQKLREKYKIFDTLTLSNKIGELSRSIKAQNDRIAEEGKARQGLIDQINKSTKDTLSLVSDISVYEAKQSKIQSNIELLQDSVLKTVGPQKIQLEETRQIIQDILSGGSDLAKCSRYIDKFRSQKKSAVFKSNLADLDQEEKYYRDVLKALNSAISSLDKEYNHNTVKSDRKALAQLESQYGLNYSYISGVRDAIDNYCHQSQTIWREVEDYMVGVTTSLDQGRYQGLDVMYTFLRRNLLNPDGSIKSIDKNFIHYDIRKVNCNE